MNKAPFSIPLKDHYYDGYEPMPIPEPAHVHKDGQPRRIRMDVEEYLLMKQELGDASS